MRLREIQVDSRMFAGMANNPLMDAMGVDASVKFSSPDGKELAAAEASGMTDPSLILKIGEAPWLEARCKVEKSKLGPLESVTMDEWHIVECRTGTVLGVCNFRTFRDQLLEFYDWYSSLVKDDAGNTIGRIKGMFRFRRLIPGVASLSEKRHRIYRANRLLATVARPPRFWEQLNPFRIKLLSNRTIIRFEDSISEEDRLFVYGVCLVSSRSPL